MRYSTIASMFASLCVLLCSGNAAWTQELVGVLRGHKVAIRSLAISPDGKILASGDSFVDKPGEVKIWELLTGHEIATFRKHTEAISGLAFSPDGKLLASAGHDKKVYIWQIESRKVLSVLEFESTPWDPWFLSNETMLIMSFARPFQLWDLCDSEKPVRLKNTLDILPGGPAGMSHTRTKLALAYNFIGEKAPTKVERGDVILLDAKSGRELRRLPGQNGSLIETLVFSSDDKKLATGGDDKVVRIWDLEKGGKPIGLHGHHEHVSIIAFSPDNQLLVTADFNGVIKFWDIANQRLIATVEAHNEAVTGLVFTPDGKLLISSSHDKTLKIWKVPAMLNRPQ